ncbi:MULTISPECIES: SDR family oxidoreductase [unclassified Variovorax]|uniref:SDR family oxidoreductase n=2 Tax=Variovorax TaxID=34072 RepID=UPI000C9CFD7E|nr:MULTISPECIES: SDR family oxidoreductase [unclassified Variovorax]PNG58693.1 putative oxidoreductase [Variovorax sp. B4]PNG61517.1 putative oxidoreductase [Variovorax sp. B2]VTV12458.1 putative oxidoreductase [Variovorax sp. WDL1]
MKPLAFITGASSGIGQALAARFHEAGYRLALVARRAAEIEAWGAARGIGAGDIEVYGADVAHIDSIVAAGAACVERQGVPDVVVANAGISVGIDTEDRRDLDVLAETLAVNNVGLAATFHPFVAAMRARGSGRLVGIASVAAIRGLPGHGAYCASKAGVVAYCESLRGELRASGVKVVTLLPGYVDTPLTRGNRYGMPFLLQPEAFAERAFRAIEAGASYRVIPWQMGVVAKLMRLLPNGVFDLAVQGRGRKKRRND